MDMRRVALLGDTVPPTVLCGYFTFATLAMFQQWSDGDSPAFYPWLWPWVFTAAAVLLAAYTVRPSHSLGSVAGSVMVGAVLSRGCVLFFTWADGSLSFWRAFLGAVTWWVLGWAISMIWIRLLELRGR